MDYLAHRQKNALEYKRREHFTSTPRKHSSTHNVRPQPNKELGEQHNT